MRTIEIKTLYDRIFIIVWTTVLAIVSLIFGLERFGISVEQSIRNRAVVNFSSPPISSFGESSVVVEISNHGRITDAGFPQMTLELINPVPFTRVVVGGNIKRRIMHQGLYSKQGFEAVYGSAEAYGILKYSDPQGVRQKIYIWLAWPDYDQSEYTVLYHFRTAVSDEIPQQYGIPMTDPTSVLRGAISNIRLEIPYPSNS